MSRSTDWILSWASPIELALIAAVVLAALLAVAGGRRGGQYRGLPGWGGFWVVFGLILFSLGRLNRWISFTMLGSLMFVALRAYFFVAPVRPRDRYAILAAYVSIPFALWPAFIGNTETFVATVPVTLFLLVPVFLVIGASEEGLLDAMGRTLLGVLFFVFCLAHVGLLVHRAPGLVALFGILVLAGELPQRLAGRYRAGSGWLRPTLGIVAAFLLAVFLGFQLGPWCGLVEEDGGRAGFLIVVAVTLGAQVSGAVARGLALSSASSWWGHGSILNRMVPAVYAAPVYFHYLNHFV